MPRITSRGQGYGDDSRLMPGMGWLANALAHKNLCTKNPRPENTGRGTAGERIPPAKQGLKCKNRLKCHPEAPPKPKAGQIREITNPQTASRTAEMGKSDIITRPIGAVGVIAAAVGDVLHVQPPAAGANVVQLSGAPHPAHVILPIRRALVV